MVDCRTRDDFDAKLESLKPDWEALVPGFALYFQRSRAQKIKGYYLVPHREIVNLRGSSGRTTTNAVEAVNSLLQQSQGGRKLAVDKTIKCFGEIH